MSETLSKAVSNAISVFYNQCEGSGWNRASSEAFVKNISQVFETFSGATLQDQTGLKSALLICKRQGADTTEMEKFIPLN